MFQKHINKLDTLVVGSSHGDFVFNPEFFSTSFNACCRSQDLKHSYLLYKQLSKENNNIKNVILFYSIFSSACELEKSPSEKEISLALNEIFHLNIKYQDPHLQHFAQLIQGKLDEVAAEIPGNNGFFPDHGKGFFPEEYTAKRRAEDHLKYNVECLAQIYLEMIIQLAKTQQHKLYILLPPARTDYKQAAGESSHLFRHLHSTLKELNNPEFIEIINFYDDPKFQDQDFGDFDHLLPKSPGTKHLTEHTKTIIKK